MKELSEQTANELAEAFNAMGKASAKAGEAFVKMVGAANTKVKLDILNFYMRVISSYNTFDWKYPINRLIMICKPKYARKRMVSLLKEYNEVISEL